MNKTQSTLDLRLHVDEAGVIWFGTDKESWKPHASELSVVDFSSQDWVRDATRIRLFGSRKNARLISTLMSERHRDKALMPPTMSVCSPIFLTDEIRNDPARVLRLMDEVRIPGSCGGWHELDDNDLNIYFMAAQTELVSPENEDQVDYYLRKHPAYAALTFIPTHNKFAALDLLNHILDPRWFVDPAHPDRTSRLRSYLGLRPEVMEKVFLGQPKSKQENRAKLVLNTWSTGDYSSADINNPASFLMRTVRDAEDREKGLLKASIRFISFLRGVWLNATAPRGRTLFVPKYFFDTEEEVKAFEEHTAKHVERSE